MHKTPRQQIAQLEELLARYQETIAEQEQTIENLAADNALLKRAVVRFAAGTLYR